MRYAQQEITVCKAARLGHKCSTRPHINVQLLLLSLLQRDEQCDTQLVQVLACDAVILGHLTLYSFYCCPLLQRDEQWDTHSKKSLYARLLD